MNETVRYHEPPERAAPRWTYLRDLLRSLLIREIKGQYKDSLLGMAWTVINPLLYLLILYFLFQLVFSFDIPRFASFAFTGVLAWTWFQGSLNQAVTVIRSNPDLVGHPGFPVAVLPVASVAAHLVNFLIGVPLLLAVLLLEGARPAPVVLALPLLMGIQFALTLSLAYFVAAVNVTFRDTQHILAVLLNLLFFLTPIFYDAAAVPEPYGVVYLLNPMAHLVEAYRDVLMRGAGPDWVALAGTALFSAALLVLGFKVFYRASHRFLEEL